VGRIIGGMVGFPLRVGTLVGGNSDVGIIGVLGNDTNGDPVVGAGGRWYPDDGLVNGGIVGRNSEPRVGTSIGFCVIVVVGGTDITGSVDVGPFEGSLIGIADSRDDGASVSLVVGCTDGGIVVGSSIGVKVWPEEGTFVGRAAGRVGLLVVGKAVEVGREG
jgi:hypothetical protein